MITAESVMFVLVAASLWSVFCRVTAMEPGVTRLSVGGQYLALAVGLVASVVLPAPWAKPALAAGVFLFLLLGAWRWRHGPPVDTRRPEPVAEWPPEEPASERVVPIRSDGRRAG